MNDSITIIDIWKTIINNMGESWVVFENGTCVICLEPQDDLETQAKEILKDWGPIIPGTDRGDFKVQKIENLPGWVVFYAHPDIANYVSVKELQTDNTEDSFNDLSIGLIGRSKRHLDSQSLKIIHVENKINH